jgi:spore germination cell wall hydrolase CwlJ-like protein
MASRCWLQSGVFSNEPSAVELLVRVNTILRRPGRVHCLTVVLVMVFVGAGCASTPPSDAAPKRSAQVLDVDTAARECVALAMYWEARGEGRRGMYAVGSVVLNRVEDPRFPSTPCAVVREGGETPPCQFSWWCDGKSDWPRDRGLWALALGAADDVLAERAADQTGGALFFHSTAIDAPWRRQRTARIGNHVFYR